MTETYNRKTLKNLVNDASAYKETDEAEYAKRIKKAYTYIQRFFFKLKNPLEYVIFKDGNKYSTIKMTDITYLLEKITYKWFVSCVDDFYYIANDPYRKELTYTEDGVLYINIAITHRFWDSKKKFKDFDKEAQNGVHAILEHIKSILCSKNIELYNYVINFIADTLLLKKVKKCLYFRSQQGTGKSLIWDNLVCGILESKLSTKCSDINYALGSFNSILKGKNLVLFEELAFKNKSEWATVSNKMKDIITSDKMQINEKGKPVEEHTNKLNNVICTNKNGLYIESSDRRYVVCDVSNEKIGDFEYFNKLGEYIDDEKVQEAFFIYCKEFKAKKENINFQYNKIPMTKTKVDVMCESLNTAILYLKQYALKNIDVDMLFSKFFDGYEKWCGNNDHKHRFTKISLSREIKNIDENYFVKGGQNKLYIKINAKQLLEYMKSKSFISDVDDIEE